MAFPLSDRVGSGTNSIPHSVVLVTVVNCAFVTTVEYIDHRVVSDITVIANQVIVNVTGYVLNVYKTRNLNSICLFFEI